MPDRIQQSGLSTAVRTVLVSVVAWGCTTDAGQSAPTPHADSADNPAPAKAEVWRFRPTLDENLPAGAVAEPVLELSEPSQRSVVVIAAVLRADAPRVQLERWTYEQMPDRDDALRLVDEGVAIVRDAPSDARKPELDAFRRRLAAPQAVVTREMGLAAEPKATITAVAEAIAAQADAKAAGSDRVVAMATVVRGLDDTIVFERDALALLSTVMIPAPANIAIETHSERRATATFETGDRRVRLAMQRKAAGWAISEVNVSSAADDKAGRDAAPAGDSPP